MDILSIDTWGNEEDGYDWNAWYIVRSIEREEFNTLSTNADYIEWFIANGYVIGAYTNQFEIEDDQYNIIIKDKQTQEPLYAIEYGCHY